MKNLSDDVYRDLQKALNKLPISFPATESGVEIRILKHIFTPEQAFIGSKLSFKLKPLKEVYKSLNEESFSIEKVEKILDEMHKLGLIIKVIRNREGQDVKYYAASAFMLGFYEFQMNKMTEEFIHDVDQYFEEAFMDELNKTKIPQLRTIPIEKEIGVERSVSNYDDFRYFLENCGEPIVLNECICRKKNDIIGESCKLTDLRESCLSFRSAGQAYLDRGLGRIITKEEALSIIEQAEREGLVIQAGNSQRPMSICLCCGCCCNLLVNEKKLDAPAQFLGSNYFAEVDEDLCIGCGVCETRCQMDAIEIIDEISKVNLDRCIGCGVCVPTCPEEAIKLIKKEEKDLTIPAKNTMETYLKIAKKKAELENK
ncbi:MAG: 4Fe-4S dicluster domain-containing protein [Promethearchaeota archaeon]|nr:MAG: 4Fe-4S dicluster domain-containing protein [Candidatus Lokiarchaeota archaeon]